jgi:hypothetical protein
LLAADQCLTRSLDMPVTAPLAKVPRENTPELKWYGQIASPQEQLQTVARTNCEAAAALRFIRVPWLATVDNEIVLGDLRYDRETELGFSEIPVTEQPNCPSVVPQWTEPRLDLLTKPVSMQKGRERVTSASP